MKNVFPSLVVLVFALACGASRSEPSEDTSPASSEAVVEQTLKGMKEVPSTAEAATTEEVAADVAATERADDIHVWSHFCQKRSHGSSSAVVCVGMLYDHTGDWKIQGYVNMYPSASSIGSYIPNFAATTGSPCAASSNLHKYVKGNLSLRGPWMRLYSGGQGASYADYTVIWQDGTYSRGSLNLGCGGGSKCTDSSLDVHLGPYTGFTCH